MGAVDSQIYGRVRKVLEAIDEEAQGSSPIEVTLTQQLELLIAQATAPYQEFVRPGRAFWTGTTVAVAGVVAIPTTAIMLALFNNDPDGGRSLVVDWVAASGVAKTAAAGQQQLLGLIGQLRETAPTTAGLSVKRRNGMGGAASDTCALTTVGGTALPATTGLAANWFPLGPAVGSPGAAATPGHGAYHAVKGDIIVPPGRYFAMHVLSDVVGSTYQGFIGWHELTMQLG
jgi:hypothetical protein